MLQQCVAQLVEAARPVLDAYRGPRPAVESPARGRDSIPDLGDARVGRGGDGLLSGRRDVVVATVLGFDPFPVDVELIGVDKRSRRLQLRHLVPHPEYRSDQDSVFTGAIVSSITNNPNPGLLQCVALLLTAIGDAE